MDLFYGSNTALIVTLEVLFSALLIGYIIYEIRSSRASVDNKKNNKKEK